MPEKFNDRVVFSLSEVAQSVQKTLLQRYSSTFWVKAEMNKLNYYHYSGHCYPELVEKKDGKIIAQFKSTLWKDDYETINNNFLHILKEPLKDSIKILFSAKITYDAVYGLSLRITDIDPSFTLGDLEREKQETIARLRTENLFTLNKQQTFPLLPQRIAVISVETSKGYADFLKICSQNPWGYAFFHFLFPSLLQGEKAVDSIINQLSRIRRVKHHFDVVVIVRGGGGDVGLSCYNNYKLAREIACFPLPVITGIGHATNETVVEMVAYRNLITPTKSAEFLIQAFHNFSVPVNKATDTIKQFALGFINEQKYKWLHTSRYLRSVAINALQTHHTFIGNFRQTITMRSIFYISNNKSQLIQYGQSVFKGTKNTLLNSSKFIGLTLTSLKKSHINFHLSHQNALLSIQKHINALDPVNVLKRGYSISYYKGKIIRKYTDLKKDDTITTVLYDGTLKSKIISTQKSHTNDPENKL
ncbi:MAG: Exodeoxyribonuclease 7 large subunit [Bacteroidetes bacterium ADurb.Bin408]|nr:MAG: Exodeoxyribonuclease 7 large subunit [Bacteroidetes bacterium ADurb.Bin408]